MIRLLQISCLLAFVSCQPAPKPTTLEVPASSRGCQRAFVEEHEALMQQVIRLKAALKLCQEAHP